LSSIIVLYNLQKEILTKFGSNVRQERVKQDFSQGELVFRADSHRTDIGIRYSTRVTFGTRAEYRVALFLKGKKHNFPSMLNIEREWRKILRYWILKKLYEH